MRRWLDHLPLAQRLLLSSVAFAGPIAILVLVALASTSADLDEARRGAAALSRLREAGTGATAAPTATSAMADELPEARDRIARAVTVLAAARARRALSPTDGAMLAASAEVVETRDLPGLVAAFQKVGGEPAAAASRLEAAARSFLASLRKVQSGEDASIATALAQGNAALDAADALRATALSRLGDELEGRVVRHERLRLAIVALALLAAAIGASHVHYIVTGLSAPMGRLTEVASRIAEGRLADARAGVESGLATLAGGEAEGTPPRNEIRKLARAMKEMTASLLSLLSEVRRSGDGVADSARRLSTSARDLEATASEQAASSHEVTATSREISRRAGSLARTMGELGAVARETAALASTGRSALTGMEAGILELTSATGSVSARLSAISGKAESIGAVVTTIGRVAEQTNLLSLNAAIEAEKAGDAGRGFAVVAREIRRLADRTAHSAVDIGDMVQGMRSAVRSGVTEMDGFVASVRKAGDDLRGIGGQLESVIDRVSALLPRFAEVGTEVEAQAASAGQISEAMAQVSSGARQTRDALEELGRLLSRLRDASDGLSREVARFHLDGTEGS